jgi:hypothetical protein
LQWPNCFSLVSSNKSRQAPRTSTKCLVSKESKSKCMGGKKEHKISQVSGLFIEHAGS